MVQLSPVDNSRSIASGRRNPLESASPYLLPIVADDAPRSETVRDAASEREVTGSQAGVPPGNASRPESLACPAEPACGDTSITSR
jgi:hypothetical protein